MSDADRVSLKYVPETVYNATPANSPAWKSLPYNNEDLSGTPQSVRSAEIRADRHISDMPNTGQTIGGNVDFELAYGDFDDLIEAALCGTWAADEVKVGVTDRSFSIEKCYEDLAAQYVLLTGMRVGMLSLALRYGQIVTGQCGFAGAGVTAPGASAVGTGTVAAAAGAAKLNAAEDVTALKIDGAASNLFFSELNLSIDNSLRARTAIGRAGPVDQRKGDALVTGNAQIYFAGNAALYSKILNNTPIALEFTISDGSNDLTFILPHCKLAGPAASGGGKNSDVMQRVDFTALYDSVAGTSLRIQR